MQLQFKPAIALTIIAGISFGGESGFLVGAMMMGKIDHIKIEYGLL